MALEYVLASSVPPKLVIDFHLKFKYNKEPDVTLLLVKKSIEENLLEKTIPFTSVNIAGTCTNEKIEYHVNKVSKRTKGHEEFHRLWYRANQIIVNRCNYSLDESVTHAFQEFNDSEDSTLARDRVDFSLEAAQKFLKAYKASPWQIERLVILSRIDFSQKNIVAFIYAMNKLQHYAVAHDIRKQFGETKAINIFIEAIDLMTKQTDQQALNYLLKQVAQKREYLRRTIPTHSKKLYLKRNEFVSITKENTALTIHSTSNKANLAVAQAIHKHYHQLNVDKYKKYFVKETFFNTMQQANNYETRRNSKK